MSVGAILAIAILATGMLLIRFRKRWLAKINIAVTNRITSLFAGSLPGFRILTQVGGMSGKVYRTPVRFGGNHHGCAAGTIDQRKSSRRDSPRHSRRRRSVRKNRNSRQQA